MDNKENLMLFAFKVATIVIIIAGAFLYITKEPEPATKNPDAADETTRTVVQDNNQSENVLPKNEALKFLEMVQSDFNVSDQITTENDGTLYKLSSNKMPLTRDYLEAKGLSEDPMGVSQTGNSFKNKSVYCHLYSPIFNYDGTVSISCRDISKEEQSFAFALVTNIDYQNEILTVRPIKQYSLGNNIEPYNKGADSPEPQDIYSDDWLNDEEKIKITKDTEYNGGGPLCTDCINFDIKNSTFEQVVGKLFQYLNKYESCTVVGTWEEEYFNVTNLCYVGG